MGSAALGLVGIKILKEPGGECADGSCGVVGFGSLGVYVSILWVVASVYRFTFGVIAVSPEERQKGIIVMWVVGRVYCCFEGSIIGVINYVFDLG